MTSHHLETLSKPMAGCMRPWADLCCPVHRCTFTTGMDSLQSACTAAPYSQECTRHAPPVAHVSGSLRHTVQALIACLAVLLCQTRVRSKRTQSAARSADMKRDRSAAHVRRDLWIRGSCGEQFMLLPPIGGACLHMSVAWAVGKCAALRAATEQDAHRKADHDRCEATTQQQRAAAKYILKRGRREAGLLHGVKVSRKIARRDHVEHGGHAS